MYEVIPRLSLSTPKSATNTTLGSVGRGETEPGIELVLPFTVPSGFLTFIRGLDPIS